MATESTSSSPLRSFRVESSPGHGPPIHRSYQAAAAFAALSPSLLLASPSPRRVASRGLTGEAGHLKYSSDAGLNEARPKRQSVNLLPSSLCILHSRRACWCVCVFSRIYSIIRATHTHREMHRRDFSPLVAIIRKDEIDSATNADFTLANVMHIVFREAMISHSA